MPPLPSRDVLEAMKRVDLQRLCKDYGVKANLKSEALIDLLLDTQSVSTISTSCHYLNILQVDSTAHSKICLYPSFK